MIRSRRGRELGYDLLAGSADLQTGSLRVKVPAYAPPAANVSAAAGLRATDAQRFAVTGFTGDEPDPTALPCRDGPAHVVLAGGGTFRAYLRDALIADLRAGRAAAETAAGGVPLQVHVHRLEFGSFASGHWRIEASVRVGDGSAQPVSIHHGFAPTFHWADGTRLAARTFPAAVAAFNCSVIELLQ